MSSDAVTHQMIADSLAYASEEMGYALRNSAYSPNIKERMDHSAALFDSEGRLLAQAEHIPVHLGSLPWGLGRIIDRCGRDKISMDEGVMVAASDPYLTGTHLNDVTVVAPIHHQGTLAGFAVNKAHHSDVGGVVPGSISATARTLSEEGFVLEPTIIWRKERLEEDVMSKFAAASRTPQERMGDFRAQIAANVTGKRRVIELIRKYGIKTFGRAGSHAISHAEALSRRRIARLRKGTYEAVDYIEGPAGEDLQIRARVRVSGEGVEIDYSGTAPEVEYPMNAVFGVTISGAYYVFRCLTGSDIPANHGAFAPVKVYAPEGTIVNPTYPHPVGGGNVETSQRNADVLFKAFYKAAPRLVSAAAGGSMNNIMAGGLQRRKPWAFYETIGVGLGGSWAADGMDGIQANMTNTMNTPIEEMERSFPFRVMRYEFRPDSSGPGRRRGGSGLVRTYMVLADRTSFTILSDRERHSPWGLQGGGDGAKTEVYLTKGGTATRVPCKSTHILGRGDMLEIRTAGGGGYGDPTTRPRSEVERDVEDGFVTRARARMQYRQQPKKGPRRPPVST